MYRIGRVIAVVACFGILMSSGSMAHAAGSPYYRDMVAPVQAQQLGTHTLRLTYQIPVASAVYPVGVDYTVKDGVMKVFIKRCLAQQPWPCRAKVMNNRPSDDPDLRWRAVVDLPYDGESVIMVFRDGEQRVYPPAHGQ